MVGKQDQRLRSSDDRALGEGLDGGEGVCGFRGRAIMPPDEMKAMCMRCKLILFLSFPFPFHLSIKLE